MLPLPMLAILGRRAACVCIRLRLDGPLSDARVGIEPRAGIGGGWAWATALLLALLTVVSGRRGTGRGLAGTTVGTCDGTMATRSKSGPLPWLLVPVEPLSLLSWLFERPAVTVALLLTLLLRLLLLLLALKALPASDPNCETGGVCGGTGHCRRDGDISTLLEILSPPTLSV